MVRVEVHILYVDGTGRGTCIVDGPGRGTCIVDGPG